MATDKFQQFNDEKDISDYFLSLKQKYQDQRQPYEYRWEQARAAVYLDEDRLDTVYQGRAKINSPIMKWKVNGVTARINRILFNVEPFGRLEDKKIGEVNENVVDLWNKFIFAHQLDEIEFKENFKRFVKCKSIEGTAVAKITQEFETKEIDFFEGEEAEEVIIKDNTYFRPMVLEEFYSDVSKYNINDSQACIHSSVISMEELRKNKKRRETEVFDLIDPETGEVVGQEEKAKEVGIYHNLELLESTGSTLTEEQEDYLQLMGFNITQTQIFQKNLKESKKTGFVQIDECYGKYVINGKEKECVCTIANGRVVIRFGPTPFKHKKYVRPFIVGRYEPVPNRLYGQSNVIAGDNLLKELNATRAQAVDAKTRSISNMWYEDTSKQVKWDKVWGPNKVIKGIGQNGLQPILNPYLGSIAAEAGQVIQRDLDQLWSLSPVQEGTTDSRLIPETARGTLAVIQQNDMPLNDIIDNTIEEELKPFFEMIFERNLTFKTSEDLLIVWDEKDIQKSGITAESDMKELMFDFNVKILGNLELSNELAHQNGYVNFLNFAQSIPPIARRLNWQVISDKMLRSFGIKDDAQDIFLEEEVVQEIFQEEQQAEQQAVQQNEGARQQQRQEGKEDYLSKVEIDTESKIVEMQSEAVIERSTGQKVQ